MTDDEPVAQIPDTGLPDDLFRRVAERARFERLDESGEWFATVPGYEGAWATDQTQDTARQELVSVLRDWTAAKAHFNNALPPEINDALALRRSG